MYATPPKKSMIFLYYIYTPAIYRPKIKGLAHKYNSVTNMQQSTYKNTPLLYFA